MERHKDIYRGMDEYHSDQSFNSPEDVEEFHMRYAFKTHSCQKIRSEPFTSLALTPHNALRPDFIVSCVSLMSLITTEIQLRDNITDLRSSPSDQMRAVYALLHAFEMGHTQALIPIISAIMTGVGVQPLLDPNIANPMTWDIPIPHNRYVKLDFFNNLDDRSMVADGEESNPDLILSYIPPDIAVRLSSSLGPAIENCESK
jgi:hypothetical protein